MKSALLLGTWLACACAVPAEAAGTARTHTVTIEAMAYAPAALTVRAGDTVVWINRDPFPHTATAQDRSFDSGEIAPGQRSSRIVRTKGKFSYVCTLHPTMKATLVVE